ncbi:hypothetical protein DFH08DRAFT_964199 [Mycena albidolilacea]|uniref:Uncharacterized protein n=1 Tax=Mycena albidolilacea TaxID=1033008 RepID=A0AAD6ZTN2_9AGAR|nr:hypothetical protein DFH08DRAFT_964199 [Mycena albidolilacea]
MEEEEILMQALANEEEHAPPDDGAIETDSDENISQGLEDRGDSETSIQGLMGGHWSARNTERELKISPHVNTGYVE